MKWQLRFLLAVILCASNLCASDEIITIYNKNFASIRQRTDVKLSVGSNTVNITPIPTTILPSSVKINAVNANSRSQVIEQQFRYDLSSASRVIEKSIGQTVDVTNLSGKEFSGILISASDNFLTISGVDKHIELLRMDQVSSVSALPTGNDVLSKPRLQWLVESNSASNEEFEISYLADSIGWSADYVAVLNNAEDSVFLTGWATLTNNCGRDFENARIKLVAGDVNWDRPRPIVRDREYGSVSDLLKVQVGVVDRPFFEYHLYALERSTDLFNREIKQIPLFEAKQASVNKKFLFNLLSPSRFIEISAEFANSENSGLGLPLPAGKFRLMKADIDGTHEFLGEGLITHVAVDESFKVKVGTAFDLTSETLLLERRTENKRTEITSCEFTFRNHKNVPVDIVCYAAPSTRVEIMSSNVSSRQIAPNRAEILVHVDVGGETKVIAKIKVN